LSDIPLISNSCLRKANFAVHFCRLTGGNLYAIVTTVTRLCYNPHLSLRVHVSEQPARRMPGGNLDDVD